MKNKKYAIYIELKGRLLTQVGYLKGCGLDFSLTDKSLADTYEDVNVALENVKKFVRTLNWDFYSAFSRKIEEV